MASRTGRLEGKVAVISGGARGMGGAHARLMAAEGCKVVIGDRLIEAGEKTAADIGANARFQRLDVTSEDDWQAIIAFAEKSFGPVDILVNNAGIATGTTVADLTLAEYRHFMDTNATSVFLGMRAVVPSMRRAKGGSIINTSSIAGQFGTSNHFAYTASKFAVTGMTKSAAIDLAKDGIRVNSVHPGYVSTPMSQALESTDPVHIEFLNQYLASVPVGRAGREDELSPMILFLASDESSFCTGAEFTADGGATCQA